MGVCCHIITKERRKYGERGMCTIPQVIGAEKVLPARQLLSRSGDGGFTRLMGDFINSLLDGEAWMRRSYQYLLR
jgi:hypothetical protein